MVADLKQSYHRMLLPALLAVAAAAAIRAAVPLGLAPPGGADLWGALLFVPAVAAAVAGPVGVRTLFAHRVRQEQTVSEADFAGFQRQLMRTALVAPYLAAVGLPMGLPRFYMAGIVLAALYALYYTYPSRRRIDFDRRIFRVQRQAP